MANIAECNAPLSGLSLAQREAAAGEMNALVIACPGSGKTSTLVARALWLAARNPESRIVMITFTRDAAHVIRSRIAAAGYSEESGEVGAGRLTIGTFHALCARHLRDTGRLDGHLLAPGEEFVYYRRVAEHFGYESAEEAARRVETARCDPESMIDNPTTENERAAAYYQRLLKRNHMRDFIDMIRMTVEGMSAEGDQRLEPIRADYWLIDEFQDLDALQYRLLSLHHTRLPHAVFTAVGDDDQSIYGWRGALGYRGMLDFERDFSASRTMLTINYRSCSEVVDGALRLIAGNAARYDKPMTSARGSGGTISARSYDNSYDEATETIAALALKTSVGTRAILARTNAQLAMYAIECARHNLPYVRLAGGKGGLFGDEPACHLLSLMRAVVHPASRRGVEALWTVLRVGKSDRERLAGKNMSEVETLVDGLSGEAGTKRVGEVIAVIREARTYAKGGEVGATDAIATLADYVRANMSNGEGTRVIDSALKYLSQMRGSVQRRLSVLNRVGLRSGNERTDEDIVLSTLHGAKGLEFDRVHIVGFQCKKIPHERTLAPSEERRLAYVGITRARDALVLSAVATSGLSPYWAEMNGGLIA